MSYDLGTAHGKIVLEYDGEREVDRAKKDIDTLERKAKEGDSSLGKLGKALKVLGSGAGTAGLAAGMAASAAQAAAMAVQVLGMVPALASIVSLSAAIPGALAGAVVTSGVLKAAFVGIGDAVKYAFDPEDAEKFNKALEKMSPNAKAFTLAFKDSVPALKAVQQGIQDAFFNPTTNLQALLPRLVAGLQSLQPQLQALARTFADLGKEIGKATLDRDVFWEFMDEVTISLRENLQKLIPAIAPLVSGLLSVGAVGLPLFDKLGTAVANGAAKFGAWMTEISRSGQLQAWIDTALATLSQLGTIISNVGSILNSVFTAAQASGGGLLGTLAEITGQFADFLSSAEGMDALTGLFSGILAVAKALAPALITLVSALAKALGPAIADIAENVGPVLLQVVQALAPAFAPLANAIASLLAAVAPLAPPLAQLIALLAQGLGTAVQGLVAELGPLIGLIGQTLMQAFTELTPLIGEFAQFLPVAAEAGMALFQAFAPLMPVIVELARVLATELIAVMPQLTDAIRQVIPVFSDLASQMSGTLIEGLTQLIKYLPAAVQAFAALLPVLIQVLTFGLRLMYWAGELGVAIRNLIGTVLSFAGSLISGLVNGLIAAYNGVVSAGTAIINWFRELPGRLLAFLKALPGMLGNLFVGALRAAATAVGFGAGLIVGIVTKLPGRIWEGLKSLGGLIGNLFSNAWTAIKNLTTTAFNNVVNFIKNFPRRAWTALQNLGPQLQALFRTAMARIQTATVSGLATVYRFFKDLPNRIKNALGNLGNLLLNAGKNIINGLMNGIRSGIDKVMGMVGDLAGRVKNAFNKALDIFSPSRVFFRSGVFIDRGLIDGMKSQLGLVKRAAEELAATVIRPTVALPTAAAGNVLNTTAPRAVDRVNRVIDNINRELGPYHFEVGGQALVSVIIDAVTGHPRIVGNAAAEGQRRTGWIGSGRGKDRVAF